MTGISSLNKWRDVIVTQIQRNKGKRFTGENTLSFGHVTFKIPTSYLRGDSNSNLQTYIWEKQIYWL